MYKNSQIQEYESSNPRQLVQNLIPAKYRTRQILYVYSFYTYQTIIYLFISCWLNNDIEMFMLYINKPGEERHCSTCCVPLYRTDDT